MIQCKNLLSDTPTEDKLTAKLPFRRQITEVLIRSGDQEVDGVVRSDAAALDESVRHGGHDVLHEVVAQWCRLSLNKLLLLALHVLQTLSLHNPTLAPFIHQRAAQTKTSNAVTPKGRPM